MTTGPVPRPARRALARLLPVAAVLALVGQVAPRARAEVQGEAVVYRHGDVVLEGYLARDAAQEGRRPGVLVCHAWMGHGEPVRRVARDLAARGYVAFALDMYGQGVHASDAKEAGALAGRFKGDVALMRARARAGLEVLAANAHVDPERIVAVGFCFGGTTVLELARDGAPLAGVVSFHGGLSTPEPDRTKDVRTRILAVHGGDDPFVSETEVVGFWREMKAARADHQILILSGAVHSFTDEDAGSDPSRGAAYDAKAARRAWDAAYRFFEEVLAR